MRPEQITHVFLTSFEPERRRAIEAFESAAWWIHEPEYISTRESIEAQIADAEQAGDDHRALGGDAEPGDGGLQLLPIRSPSSTNQFWTTCSRDRPEGSPLIIRKRPSGPTSQFLTCEKS